MDTRKVDIILMSDNNLETVGGEQESTKIIIEGIEHSYLVGVIQPGLITEPHPKVKYYRISESTRLKHLIRKPILFIQYIINVKKIINSSKPVIIHTQAQVSFFIVSLLKKMCLISDKIKIVHTERGFYLKYDNLIKYIFYFFMKELDTLVTTTKLNRDYWEAALTKRGLKINYRIIENTAGKLFEEYDESLEKKPDESLVIGFSGRYTDWKNWPLAIKISEEINNLLGSKLKVKMAIGCLDEESEIFTKKMFEHLSMVLGDRFEGQINVSLEEMNRFYYDLDIFILTSKDNTESFGRTLVEAMSRRTAVLTTNAGGAVEVVGKKENVCMTLEDFKERIIEFYNDRELLEKEKDNNVKRVNSVYTYQNNILKHKRLYKETYEKTIL